MTKTITTYTGFILAFALMVITFVTAKTYTQLAIAIVLYPLLAYFALRVLPKGGYSIKVHPIRRSAVVAKEIHRSEVEITDIDKRTFLKLIGTAGLTFFVFSILGQRVGSWLFGGSSRLNGGSGFTSGTSSLEASPSSNYRVSEIDDSGIVAYYGFIGPDGSWFIMRQDSDTNSFRYTRGSSDFPGNWKNRENLVYDYYHKIF